MSDNNDDDEALRATLRAAGWVGTKAFVEPGTPVARGGGDAKPAEKSPEAKRKAEERERKLAEGWRQHNVMAPDDADARELLSYLAQKIKSKTARINIRAVLTDPKLVAIGRRVRRLRGNDADQVRGLLGL